MFVEQYVKLFHVCKKGMQVIGAEITLFIPCKCSLAYSPKSCSMVSTSLSCYINLYCNVLSLCFVGSSCLKQATTASYVGLSVMLCTIKCMVSIYYYLSLFSSFTIWPQHRSAFSWTCRSPTHTG